MKSQRELARLLATRDRTPSGLSGPQVQYSSLENGSLKEYDESGNLVSETGLQWDGSHGSYPLTGPTPPRPTAPTAEGGTSATLAWDGLFLDDNGLVDLLITAPMDWSRAEIHISQTKGFLADTAETLVDTIESPRGGSRPALPGPGTWYAVLVARSLAGKRGEQSPETEFQIVPGLTEEDVQELRDEFGEMTLGLNQALQENITQQVQLGQRMDVIRDTTLPALADSLEDAQGRLDAADQMLNVTLPGRITDISSEVSAAKSNSDTALSRADSAIIMAGSTTRILYGTTDPSGTARLGDTWRKTTSATGDILGEWRYTQEGNATPSWKPQKVTSDMVSNLDVGKLSAGSAAVAQLVAEKMAAATAAFQKADIGNLTVTGTSQLDDVVAEEMSVKIGEFIDLSTDRLVAGSASLGTGVADRFFTDIFATRKLTANQVFIGEGGNLFPAEFTDPGWAELTGATFSSTGGKTGGSSLLLPMSTSQIGSYFGVALADRPKAPRLIPGESYRIKAEVRGDKEIVAGGAAIFVRLYSLNTLAYTWATPSTITNTAAIAANTWGEIDGQFTVPEGATDTYAVIGLFSQTKNTTAALRFSDLRLQQAVTPSLIVDGFFQGLRVVGASVETNSAANRGVKMTDAGLFGYSSTGAETLRFDGTNSIITGATVRTAASGARWQMSSAGLEAWNAAGVRYLYGNATGLELNGVLTTLGQTLETSPRPISVKLTTVPRQQKNSTKLYPNPGLIFDDGSPGEFYAPDLLAGIYSPDGVRLVVTGRTDATNMQGNGVLTLDSELAMLYARTMHVGQFGITEAVTTATLNLHAYNVYMGNQGHHTTLTIFGDLDVRGHINAGVQTVELTSTASVPSRTTPNTPATGLTVVAARSNLYGDWLALPDSSTISLKKGLYAITYRMEGFASLGASWQAITDSAQDVIWLSGAPPSGSWDGYLSMANMYAPTDSFRLKFVMRQTSGAARTITTRIIISKLA